MAKPFRVKRGSKYIGAYKARIRGEVVNLETQDADEARRRERRARAGDYGWRRDAADDVKSALDGNGDVSVGDVEAAAGELDAGEAVQGVQDSPVVPEVPAAAAAAGASGPPSSPPPADPVAEVNATAAGLAGDVRETLDAAGIDLGALMNPETLGGLHVAAQDFVFRLVAPMVTEKPVKPLELPEKFGGAVALLGQAWQLQLRRWNLSLDGISPGSLILLATVGMLAVQVMGMYSSAPVENAVPSGVA